MRLHRPLHAVGLLTAALILLGCSSSTEPRPSIAGTYTLTTAAGVPLPFIKPLGDGVEEHVLGETLVVDADGSYIRSGTSDLVSSTGTTPRVYSVAGTYAVDGDGLLVFIDPALGLGFVTPSENTLTVSVSGVLFVFTRH